jgi:hypothetical protein
MVLHLSNQWSGAGTVQRARADGLQARAAITCIGIGVPFGYKKGGFDVD